MPRPPWLKQKQFQKKKYTYIPAPNSGAYAILVGMFKAEQNEFIKNLTKQQVLDYCIRYSQSTQKDNNKTWASMKSLIDKSLIGRQIAREPLYFLNEEGRDLAQKLLTLQEGSNDNNNQAILSAGASEFVLDSHDEASNSNQQPIISSQQTNSNHAYAWNEQDANFELKSGTFDIVLIIDQREKIDILNLGDNSIRLENRTLACGDFLWVARPKGINAYDRTKDIVLDYVIERKRLDDLQSSMFDGRFEQQKQRLVQSGVRRPVYLIEEFGNLRASSLTSSSLIQVMVNILIHDGLDFERVKNVAHTNDYLIGMTKCIEKIYSKMDLLSCNQEKLILGEAKENEFMTFSEFQTKGAKITNWTVREMFAKHLIQITGMSDKRVAVIIKQYPTMSALMEAYRKCDSEKDKCELLAKLQIPDSNRKIGPAISRRVYACYSANLFDFDE